MKRERSSSQTSFTFTVRTSLIALATTLLAGQIASAPTALASAGGFAVGRSHGSGGGMGFGYSTASSSDLGRFQYALINRGNELSCAVDDHHWDAIGSLQDEVQRTGRDVLWFVIEDREYVIRDAATIERANEIVEPMSRLGAEQGRLGSRQGELGRQQGEMGALQGEVGQLQAQLAALQARGDSRYRAELSELRQQLAELSAQVRIMGERQRELGAQQRVLGERQRELGAQQRRASQLAFDQLRSLAHESISDGKAEALDSN